MQVSLEFAVWGMVSTALLYVLGNAVWINQWARARMWVGWLSWSVLSTLILLIAAQAEVMWTGGGSAWARLAEQDAENHWIIISLFALLSVPGASAVIFKLDARWTQYAVLLPALVILIPMGQQLSDAGHQVLWISILIGIVSCAALVLWQRFCDVDTASQASAEASV